MSHITAVYETQNKANPEVPSIKSNNTSTPTGGKN
jgi:hypothetical protein